MIHPVHHHSHHLITGSCSEVKHICFRAPGSPFTRSQIFPKETNTRETVTGEYLFNQSRQWYLGARRLASHLLCYCYKPRTWGLAIDLSSPRTGNNNKQRQHHHESINPIDPPLVSSCSLRGASRVVNICAQRPSCISSTRS
jgi:hypothetical protein